MKINDMEDLFIPYELALLLKEKGFDEPSFGVWNNIEKRLYIGLEYDTNQNNMPNGCKAPLYQQIIDWFREKHNIDITIMPVFRDKCGYDSFKRDGYTFNIMRIDPCQFLTWVDFNQCAEDRDSEIKEEGELISLKPSFKHYYETLNIAIEEAINLI